MRRQEVDAKLAASEAKVEARLANFDTSVKAGFAELRVEFAGLRTDMVAQMAQLRIEMHKGMVDIIKWVVGFGLAILGAIFAFWNLANEPPTQAAVQPTRIAVHTQTGSASSVPIPPQPGK